MGICRTSLSLFHLSLSVIVPLSWVSLSFASPEHRIDSRELSEKMERAYARIKDYQVWMEVKAYQSDGSWEIKKFLYTFKKPNWIRLDFESPHPGLVLTYPDKNGKVVVGPSGWVSFFKLHLAPNNRLLMDPSGQRIDQTEMGILIKHIEHSLTNQRQGQPEVTEENGTIRIRVLADNPYHKGLVTLYQFFIDQGLFLPIKVEESTPGGRLQRIITFQNLKINIGISEAFFQLE